MIAIVDYGMGNLRSVQKAFERVGAAAQIVREPKEIARAEKVVLPGVGAFRDAIGHLREQGFVEPLVEAVQSGRPLLGICLGLQLLFDVSYEDGEYQGLGIVPGRVVRFDWRGRPGTDGLKIPHMGWNQLRWSEPCPLLKGLEPGQYFYFVHSYYVEPAKPIEPAPRRASGYWEGRCEYGYDFTAMIWRDNLFATQFHPEKSQEAGLKLLENFAKL
jgi:imidazole glycerol-phosphate synthase subunit HisH